jgi:hypothetical protein
MGEIHAPAAFNRGKFMEPSIWEEGWNLEKKNISTVSTVNEVGQKKQNAMLRGLSQWNRADQETPRLL